MTFKKGEQNLKAKGKHLTNKQRLFLAEYKKDCNAERAAAAAGYAEPRGSAMNLMNPKVHPLVVAEIRAMEAEKSRVSGIDAAWIVGKLGDIASYNPKDYYNADGSLKQLHELSDKAAYAIKKVETRTRSVKDKITGEITTTTRAVNYELEPKLEALKQLAQHLGKLIDHVTNIHNSQVVFDFRSLLQQLGPAPENDPIEALIEEAGK